MEFDYRYLIGWYLVFLISVILHEAAHAWAAKRGGDLTAYAGGQVSLNPWPHIKRQPWGMVVFPILSTLVFHWPFGFASTPYDPVWAHNHPRKSAWMAAAGPAANAILVIVAVILIKVGIASGIFAEPFSVNYQHIVDPVGSGGIEGLTAFLSMLFTLNLIMVVLNLIPLPPLDGSSIIALFLNDATARRYKTVISNPVFSLVGLLLAWQVFSPLFTWVFPGVMNLLYPGAGYHSM